MRAGASQADVGLSERRDDMRRLYLWALAFRFSAGMLAWLLTLLVNIPFLQDAFYYEETGAGIARDWLAGRSSEWLSWAMTTDRVSWFLPTVIGGFYWLSGGIRLIPLLLLGHLRDHRVDAGAHLSGSLVKWGSPGPARTSREA